MLINIIVVATVAAVVITSFCLKAVHNEKCRKQVKGYIVIPFFKDNCSLRRLVRSCYWEEIFADKECTRDIILLVNGESDCEEKAKQLAEEYSIVHCVYVEDLEEYLSKRINYMINHNGE